MSDSIPTTRLTLKRAFLGVTLGFVFLAALIIFLGGTTFQLSKSGTARSAELSERLLPALQELADLQESVLKYNLANLEFVTGRDEEIQARKLAAAAQERKHIDEHAAALATKLDSADARALQDAVVTSLRLYDVSITRLQQALKANEFEQAMKLLDGDVATNYAATEKALDALRTFVFDVSNRNGRETQAILERNLSLTLKISAAIAGLALLAVGFVQWLSARISRPLRHAVSQMQEFTARTSSAAQQIAGSSQRLAEGASEQAASLEETSASLEEVASMTKRNAQNARSARDLSAQAHQTAELGSTGMQLMIRSTEGIRQASSEMRTTMEGIKSASADVSKIIKTIDEIAFQTNLLALNAAVEAARAGEAGMGFAVVADEVRNLAQRSAKAAKETADMIEASIKRSEEGSRVTEKVALAIEDIAAKAGEVEKRLSDILGKSREVDAQVTQIANASEEQSQGLTQVTRAVAEMDKVTQSNAASAEESASAAEELNSQAAMLRTAVSQLERMAGSART